MQQNLGDEKQRDGKKSYQFKFDQQMVEEGALEELKPLEPYTEELKPENKNTGWPEVQAPGFSTFYLYWLFGHCVYYQIFVISRVSFE